MNHVSVRTYYRIRSARFESYSLSVNVGKGSRQIWSVASGKGLALNDLLDGQFAVYLSSLLEPLRYQGIRLFI